MSWLLLDTALPRAVVAVVAIDGTVRSEILLDETRQHAERLTGAVDEALVAAGLDVKELTGIGVGTGPGSFIGVRTGLSFARGLGAALGIDVVGIGGLLALYGSIDNGSVDAIVVVDARRGERYVGVVGVVDGVLMLKSTITAVANGDVVAGDVRLAVGAVHDLQWPEGLMALAVPGPTAIGLWRALSARRQGHVVGDSAVSPLPVYVRGADAKVPLVDPAARRAAVLGWLDAAAPLSECVKDSN